MSRSAKIVLVAALLGLVPAWGAADFERQLDLDAGGEVAVELIAGAELEIVGWDEDRVEVQATFSGPDRDNVVMSARREGARVTIRADLREPRRRQRSGGTVRVRVPVRTDLELSSAGGTLTLREVEGRLHGETLGGDLELIRLRGEIGLSTLGGDVHLEDSQVDGTVRTHGGDLHLDTVRGDLEASTLGGDVRLDGENGDDLRVSTLGGNVSVGRVGTHTNVSTLGGEIRVEAAGGGLEAKTLGGDIHIEAVDGAVRASTLGGDISVTMVGNPGAGPRDVHLTTRGGDVELTVPPGLDATVDVTVAYTRNSTRDYEIHSDLPLEVRDSGQWDTAAGEPQRRLYGRGVVGKGTNRLKIEVVNGSVRLRVAG